MGDYWCKHLEVGTVYRKKGDYWCKHLEVGTVYREKGDYWCKHLEVATVYIIYHTRHLCENGGSKPLSTLATSR